MCSETSDIVKEPKNNIEDLTYTQHSHETPLQCGVSTIVFLFLYSVALWSLQLTTTYFRSRPRSVKLILFTFCTAILFFFFRPTAISGKHCGVINFGSVPIACFPSHPLLTP